MPPKKRKPENRGLPKRWRYRFGTYYYMVPQDQREHWDGKWEFPLGRTLTDAHRVFSERLAATDGIDTLGDLIDRYQREVTPTKSERTQSDELVIFKTLRAMVGHNRPSSVRTVHCYQLYDELKKRGLTTANRHMEKLSHLFTKGIEWGVMTDHPMVGKFKKSHTSPLRTYVTDEVIAEARKSAPELIKAYIDLKLLTGLRMSDMLSLRARDWKADGLHVVPRKTKRSTGRAMVFERTPALEAAIDTVLALDGRPDITEYLFCTRAGDPYIKPNGTMNGFQSIWGRWQREKVTHRFKERDIRVKVGSDSESDEDAAKRLGHSSATTARKHYRAKPDVVRPLK